MTSAGFSISGWKSALLVGAIALLSGCEDGQGPAFLQPKKEADTGFVSTTPLVEGERDVEAPEVFSANEAALWDGRPSLGGVWVAHPDVTDPQRVIIRNTENDQSVVGALFRRERNNPGPLIQVSSDAANALGMLAGAPAKLSVIALKKETIPQPAAETEAVSEDEVSDEVQEADLAALPAATEIQSSTIDPVAVAGAAIDDAAAASATVGNDAADAEVVAAAAPAAKPAGQFLAMTKPFVQVGIFSVSENAEAAAQTLRDGGVTPEIKESTNSAEQQIYRVVVGPAASRSDRRAMINKIKILGFPDAYAVTN